MLSVAYAECHIKALYAECCYADCHYTVCCGAAMWLFLTLRMSDWDSLDCLATSTLEQINISIVCKVSAGSTITNRREPRSCLGRVFNSKLGCIATLGSKCMICMQPLLKLKTRPQGSSCKLKFVHGFRHKQRINVDKASMIKRLNLNAL